MSSGSSKTLSIEFPFDGGMDQRTHVRRVQAPQVLKATNVRYPDVGAVEKRFGIVGLTNVFSTAGGQPGITMQPGNGKLMTCRDELVVTDGFEVGSLTTVGTASLLVDKGKMPEMFSTHVPVDTTQYCVSQPDVAVASNGLTFHVWASNDRSSAVDQIPRYDIFWTVYNRDTGAEIISQGSTVGQPDSWLPHVVAVGTNACMFYVRSGTGTIVCIPWDPVALNWGAGTNIITDGEVDYGGPFYRVCTDGTNIYLVYNQDASSVYVKRINPSTGLVTATILDTNALPLYAIGPGICATAADNRVWVSYARKLGTGLVDVRVSAYDLALTTQLLAPTTVYAPALANAFGQTSIARVTSGSAIVQCWIHGSNPGTSDGRTDYVAYPIVDNSGAIIGTQTGDNRRSYWAIPASPPFVMSASPLRIMAWHLVGGAYLGTLPPPTNDVAGNIQPLQWTMTLCEVSENNTAEDEYRTRPITWQAPRYSIPDYLGNINGFPNGSNAFCVSSIVQVAAPVTGDPPEWVASCLIRRNAGTRVGLIEVRAKSKGQELWCNCEMGGAMLVGPGHYYDRKQVAEVSFSYWPQRVAVTGVATGGFLKNSEKYRYRVLYEYVDGTGAVHRSEPSDPIEVSTPAGGPGTASVTIVAPVLTCTARQSALVAQEASGVRIVVYRQGPITTPIDDLSYYRVFSDIATPKNRPIVNVLTFTDTAADFDYVGVASRKKQLDTLYTEGGVLPNVMPNGFTACVTYRNRWFVAYGNTIAWTKAFVPGEAPSFTDSFTMPCEETGTITALFRMDDTLYIATRDRIYAMAGDGPTDANTLSDFGTPNLVVTDRGVLDQRSVVMMPGGTMFQSSVGIHLLDRGRNVNNEPIGSRVQDDLVTYSEITSAILHPTGGYVSFTARNVFIHGGVYDGIRLVYDYTADRWSRDTLILSDPANGRGMLSEVESRGRVYQLTSNGGNNRLYVESTVDWRDESVWVPIQIVMAEVHPAGLQGDYGFVKWSLNAQRYSDFDITMSWFRNYESAAFDTHTITSDRISAAPEDLPFSENCTIHKAKSARLVITDAPPTMGGFANVGRGGAFIGISLEIDQVTDKIYRNASQEKS